MTQPKKVSGVPVEKLLRACRSKRRFSDDFAARAVALTKEPPLYVYQCPHCNGWHLTSKEGGKKRRADFHLKEQAHGTET